MSIKGLVIAGTHSGCGKTTISLGILTALKKKGLKLQAFKAGPDFVDSGLHRVITGRHSRNLDIWMCGEEYVKECFYKYSTDADISIIEGVMGMYDGEHSTAKLAGLLNLPVILVVDTYGMAESAGAVVAGFRDWVASGDSPRRGLGVSIAGVIFNRIGSKRHYERLKNSVHDVKVLGYLPRDLKFEIPHRHLGLTVAEENPIAEENIERLADAVLEHIDMDRIVKLANTTIVPSFPLVGNHSSSKRLRTSRNDKTCLPIHRFTHSPIVAVAYDKAFCFYYEDNLDMLRDAGSQTITFSPLSDNKIPDGVGAIYIGGGYPELYAKELSGNTAMLKSIKELSNAGIPLYAECGGLMYLSHGIYDFEGNFFKMASVFPFETQMKKGRPSLGYREIELRDDCILGKKGDRLRGHEFHYSEIISERREMGRKIYSIFDNSEQRLNDEGYRYKNTLASYTHVHFGSNPRAAENFLNFIKEN